MTGGLAHAGAIDTLTVEQRLAAGTSRRNVFIEAGPGTGKTTVSAQRFGVHRFAAEHRHDRRAVVAVSFTRAATYTLRRRVQRLWGPGAMTWPHRIVTLDTIMSDLLHDLLRLKLVVWPNADVLWPDGQVLLDVCDSWSSCGGTESTRSVYTLSLAGRHVQLQEILAPTWKKRVPAANVVTLMEQGTCTHQDVRDVLALALADPESAGRVRQRLGETMRALIVDEVFDANDLDITIIESAIAAGVAVTLVGDPWQALYLFRGARPQVIPQMLKRANVPTLPLTQSFRWRDSEQRMLATRLRNGDGVTLHTYPGDLDVVLALWWEELWDTGGGVLPLAFGSFKGGYEEAAATLLLNHVTRNIFELEATFLNDALTALNVQDRDSLRQLEPGLQDVVQLLKPGGKDAVKAAYLRLVDVIKTVSARELRKPRTAHTRRLALLQERLAFPGRLVPGLTTHQAKGAEWDVVGVRLRDTERAALAAGLSQAEDMHRKIYVACTRAHRRTIEVLPATNP
ncbi:MULTISPECIES: UvrD-helicase domain-containing protein [unclassified Rhodococcus (in: high G+C Gram-positive bacteria)]|uniref:UvrD-helicase domain-containing protein n=1 Tax=unclassified Rhodococcus (in: high G+C Gram-positive bacteria) TaxID=192944 RepID=UPI0016395A65|nr:MULTISPECIES: UvrD-helicase domain-containing protein [unclassified Rhodococcus (in: high G+C Gram-positive bacteria)]MBC2644773.1 UvrD-helicase domain-containing protein [Rhodococcus sp. 3A]MBC2898368.1 UvrD-helicase domain-containing protein [Rhodococcus sp. 4CII]